MWYSPDQNSSMEKLNAGPFTLTVEFDMAAQWWHWEVTVDGWNGEALQRVSISTGNIVGGNVLDAQRAAMDALTEIIDAAENDMKKPRFLNPKPIGIPLGQINIAQAEHLLIVGHEICAQYLIHDDEEGDLYGIHYITRETRDGDTSPKYNVGNNFQFSSRLYWSIKDAWKDFLPTGEYTLFLREKKS